MRIFRVGLAILFLGLSLALTIDDFLDYNDNIDLIDEVPVERQDGQNDIILPAFISTFIASSIVNLLFPRAPLTTTTAATTTATTTTATTTTATSSTTTTTLAPGTCRCGIEGTNRIVNGQETGINQYPWLVGVIGGVGDDSTLCGGTIVASRYIISAAHCFFQFKDEEDANGNVISKTVTKILTAADITLLIGDHNLNEPDDAKLPEVRISGLASLTLHPDGDWSSLVVGQQLDASFDASHDIAVLELKAEDELDLTTYTPACLAKSTDRDTFVGQMATVAGWGLLSPLDPPNPPNFPDPFVPHHVEMTVRDQCMVNGVDSPSDICAGDDDPANDSGTSDDTSDDLGKGPCQGDSGGPLTFKQNGQHVLIGDVSRASTLRCATPGLDTLFGRISFFRDWIDGLMTNPTFCGGTADAARRRRKFKKNKKKKNKRQRQRSKNGQ